ncbi:hypothetical protein Tco_1040475 [Tanacetum coccineum]
MMEGIDGEFNFLPKGCLNDERSFYAEPIIDVDAEPITIVGTLSKAVGKRKKVVDTSRDGPRRKTQKVPPQASKTSCDASNPLDVDSNPDIHEREVEKDKAYAELERKFNEALQDLEKNPLVLDMQIDGLRQDKAVVVSKVVPHVATELVRSDKMGLLVA